MLRVSISDPSCMTVITSNSLCNADNTNSSNLELYSVLAEHDNAGFPLSYCLLSTATALDVGKRKKALVAWAECL